MAHNLSSIVQVASSLDDFGGSAGIDEHSVVQMGGIDRYLKETKRYTRNGEEVL